MTTESNVRIRSGLPRVPGGDPWPPQPKIVTAPPSSAVAVAVKRDDDIPEIRDHHPAVVSLPERSKLPAWQRPRRIALWALGSVCAAAILVLAARGLTTLPGIPEFLRRYPGHTTLPEFVEAGFPAWARWAHFFNMFLMVLIIRSGLLVRQQQKPAAFYTPKRGGTKVSIYLWLHTVLDLLWLLNGVMFVVLLCVSGHWARIVPTSWEVVPNAVSAALQYAMLDWPVENGWVNYNSLQQLMYCAVVFLASPLAVITGLRMSQWWPQRAAAGWLNRVYPLSLARAIHYPVMWFFVLFIVVHVVLVCATGARQNLNHIFVGHPDSSWLGVFWFAAALALIAVVTWAARPLGLAPLARLFGRVSER